MVLNEDSRPHSYSSRNISSTAPCSETRPYYYYTPPPSSAKINRPKARSMRTIRPKILQADGSAPIADKSKNVSENLTDADIDLQRSEFANKSSVSSKAPCSSSEMNEFSEISRAFSDFSACSSDISGELQRLASIPEAADSCQNSEPELESSSGFLLTEMLSTDIVETISPEDFQPTVKLCVDGLQSSSAAVKRSAASKLRLLAKNRADYRELIGESGAIPALVPLLRCSDPMSQEHAVTALLNLSLHESNKNLITNAGAVKSLIYVLKTGTESSKQNAACALLSLALIEDNKLSIGACGAIPPLVALLIDGSNRGKKDALTTLYKLCSARLNKERAVTAGAVRPLVGLVGEQGSGLAEKVMAVLSSLAGIEVGCKAIVEEGGISTLLEVIEDGSDKGKEFAVLTLLQLCRENVQNREFLVREGGIPPLVALSQSGTAKAKHKAEALIQCLREQRSEASSSNP